MNVVDEVEGAEGLFSFDLSVSGDQSIHVSNNIAKGNGGFGVGGGIGRGNTTSVALSELLAPAIVARFTLPDTNSFCSTTT